MPEAWQQLTLAVSSAEQSNSINAKSDISSQTSETCRSICSGGGVLIGVFLNFHAYDVCVWCWTSQDGDIITIISFYPCYSRKLYCRYVGAFLIHKASDNPTYNVFGNCVSSGSLWPMERLLRSTIVSLWKAEPKHRPYTGFSCHP